MRNMLKNKSHRASAYEVEHHCDIQATKHLLRPFSLLEQVNTQAYQSTSDSPTGKVQYLQATYKMVELALVLCRQPAEIYYQSRVDGPRTLSTALFILLELK